MKIGVNLVWVKHKKNGGIESYINNLLDGFSEKMINDELILFVSKNNIDIFKRYESKRVRIYECNINSEVVIKRIVWENIMLDKIAKENKVDLMFIPVYSKPIFTYSSIPYVVTIHDLQALHYPNYFSKIKVFWLKFMWSNTIRSAKKIIGISNFVSKDIKKNFNVNEDKVITLYNPIKLNSYIDNFGEIRKKYNIEENNYFYTVSSMYYHKNLPTLLKALKIINEKGLNIPKKLVVSGIGGSGKDEFIKLISKLGLEDMIIITGFISDEERNSLYKHASLFLFPSIFEGFGMPPIEAMLMGTGVITTQYTSIPEVTQNKAIYVENPFDPEEWVIKIQENINKKYKKEKFCEYDFINISEQYIALFNSLLNK